VVKYHNKARIVSYCENKPAFTQAIGHTQSRTNNGFAKLVEALLQIHSFFFSHSVNTRGLPLLAVTVSLHLHYLPRCKPMRSTVTCSKTPITVNGSEPLKIRCHVIVGQ